MLSLDQAKELVLDCIAHRPGVTLKDIKDICSQIGIRKDKFSSALNNMLSDGWIKFDGKGYHANVDDGKLIDIKKKEFKREIA